MSTPFRTFFQNEFSERTRKNPRFSLRAFARLLELAPSTVHQYLSGRYYPSVKNLQQIAARLEWNQAQLTEFISHASAKEPAKTRVEIAQSLRINNERLPELKAELNRIAESLQSRFGVGSGENLDCVLAFRLDAI